MKNRFLVLGSTGQLGRAFQKALTREDEKHFFLSHQDLDITDIDKLTRCIKEIKPTVVINCTAYNDVDLAEKKSEDAFRINATAVQNLADVAHKSNIFLIHYSTDYVFDGAKHTLYTEQDTPSPLNCYGQSKLAGERALEGILKDYLLFRVSWVFGKGERNFLAKATKWASAQKEIRIAQDEVSIPTFTDDIVNATLLACTKGMSGLYHLTNTEHCSRYDWVRFYFEKKGFNNRIIPVSSDDFHLAAKRPKFSAMANSQLCLALKSSIPSWQEAVMRFVQMEEK